jgi:hypothetical protein
MVVIRFWSAGSEGCHYSISKQARYFDGWKKLLVIIVSGRTYTRYYKPRTPSAHSHSTTHPRGALDRYSAQLVRIRALRSLGRLSDA